MKITFKELTLHNFMSFTDAYITLNSPGYILVKGENENKEDNSSSNGSGKSAIFEAILFALTGETQRGISGKSVIRKNADNCSVSLSFSIDKDEYNITRSLTPSQSLTIIKNGDDISGKGVTDSKKILEEQLPDITMSLLSNVVILGQGLPNRFSLNTASGRKEVLEKLFKADFMIEDIKTRINDRLNILKDEQRVFEDNILTLNTKKNIANESIENSKVELDNMEDISTLTANLSNLEVEIKNLETKINDINLSNKEIILNNEKIDTEIITLTEKQVEINNSDYLINEIEEIKEKGLTLKSEVIALDKEIENKDNITDICPTCGQKLIGVEKPDTTKDKEKSMSMKQELDRLRNELKDLQEKRQNKLNEQLSQITSQISELKSHKEIIEDTSNIERELISKRANYDNIKNELNIFNNKKQELENTILRNEKQVKVLEEQINTNQTDKIKLDSKIEIDNKINSIIKRDFRGYLLSNIITLIDAKCKEFGQEIFGHTNICVSQDGNNISITLNDKEYELLSGGEKHSVDICCQLAIREILIKYTGFSSNIIALDEVFDNLDDVRSEKMLNLITNKLNIPSIYIITHHASIPVPYDNQIIVKKNNIGSTAIQV